MSTPAARLPAGVFVIERDWLSSNNTLLFDDEHATLIDTGYVKHAETTGRLVTAALNQCGPAKPPLLTRIVNTHLHSDHCGGNAILAAQHACRISVPAPSFATAQNWDSQAAEFANVGQRCAPFTATEAIHPGDLISGGGLDWRAHAAPGHDPCSLIFFNEQHRILISADALWQYGFGVIFPEIFGESGFAEQAAVLRRIRELDPAIVIPGHGPVFDDVSDALQRADKRLRLFTEQPRLSHEHAIKVMVKFLLLDLEKMTEQDLHEFAAQTDIFGALAGQLGQPTAQVVSAAVEALLARGQIQRDGQTLLNATPA